MRRRPDQITQEFAAEPRICLTDGMLALTMQYLQVLALTNWFDIFISVGR